MNIHQISSALYATPISTQIRETAGVIPATQSIHILAIAVVVGSALMTDLRLARVLATDESPQTIIRRYLPWMWTALAVLLTTGAILAVGEPNRVLANPIFWSKMALVVLAFSLTLLFRYPFLHPEFRLEHARWAALARPMAWVSLLIWIAVIFCGRWIAYAI
jgi:hypothetical protein